jgi:hypothetical protein
VSTIHHSLSQSFWGERETIVIAIALSPDQVKTPLLFSLDFVLIQLNCCITVLVSSLM